MAIRMAALQDVSRILEIYGPYVETTTISFEYTVPTLEEFRRGSVRHYSVLLPSFSPQLQNSPLKYTKYFCVSILCCEKKSRQQNCEALQKEKFLRQDKKNRYGKADAYHSGFLRYWLKKSF